MTKIIYNLMYPVRKILERKIKRRAREPYPLVLKNANFVSMGWGSRCGFAIDEYIEHGGIQILFSHIAKYLETAKNLALEKGLTEDKFLTFPALDTIDNAEDAVIFFGTDGPLVAVTYRFHLYRSEFLFRRAGHNNFIIIPADTVEDAENGMDEKARSEAWKVITNYFSTFLRFR